MCLPPPQHMPHAIYHKPKLGMGEVVKDSRHMLPGFLNCSGKLSRSYLSPFVHFWPLSKLGPWVQFSPVVLISLPFSF